MKWTIPILLVLTAGCGALTDPPARGWAHADPAVVTRVAETLHADPRFVPLVEDVSSVYMGIRMNLGKQESSALTARWFRQYRKEDMKRLLSLQLGASRAELIVGVIVAGGME